MSATPNVVAVVFDFDDTLTDDSTTKLLENHGIDASDFWKRRAAEMLRDGWDPTLAYLKLILDEVGPGKPLGNLTNARLREFGGALKIYPGVATLFKDLKKIAAQHPLSNPVVEFYVISGGLEEIIRGSKIAPNLNGIWGNRFSEDPKTGRIAHVKNVVTFTEKTKHLFEINNGIVEKSRREHYAVNQHIDQAKRRVPFRNMIYVGDGLTDVRAFRCCRHTKESDSAYSTLRKRAHQRKPTRLW